MRVRALSATLLGLLGLLAAPLAAQSVGTFEITGFGRYAIYDDDLLLDNEFGGGGSLGVYFARNLALEAEGSYLETTDEFNNRASHIPLRARLVYNVPLGGFASSLQLGAGYVYDLYRKDLDFDNHGVTGLAGFRIGLAENWAFRVNGTVDYVPSPDQPVDDYFNWGVQVGLTVILGNSYDRDGDGIRDGQDSCPGTPRGETVDASGCSASQRDTDRDGVTDNRDRCANTPAGETVDADGCSETQKDADGDGVPNTADKCPDTPAGAQVDASGCAAEQRDADGDGVHDAADKCPNTPAGAQVDASGCAAEQRDADGDGVNDTADQCPNTPADQPVDARGCPRDTDADGVPDGTDKCPNTPSGQAVDESGCPILFEGEERKVILKGVTFALGKADLTPESEGVLRDVVQSLVANPDVRVEVAGFTDNTGPAALNRRLSQARAETVAAFLRENGVSERQIAAVRGYGPAQPVASNRTEDGRAQNRRVELRRVN